MTKNTEDALKKLINKSKAKIANNRDDMVDTMVKNTMTDLKRDRKRASWMSLGNKEKSEEGIQKAYHHSNGNVYFHISQSYYNNVISSQNPDGLTKLTHGDILYTGPDGIKTLGNMVFWNMQNRSDEDEYVTKGGFPKTGLLGRWDELEYLIGSSWFKEGGTLYKAGKDGDWKTYPPVEGMECAVSHGGNDSHNGRYVCGQSAGACVGYVHNESWGKCAPGPPPDRAAAEGEACNYHHASLHAHGEGKPIYQVCDAEAPRCDMWGNQTSGRCVKMDTTWHSYHPEKTVVHGRKKDDLSFYQCPEGMLGPGCNNQSGGVESYNGTSDACKIGYYLYCYPDNNPPVSYRSYSSYYTDPEGADGEAWAQARGHEAVGFYKNSRLDSGASWSALTNDLNQWMVMYLGIPRSIARIVTQGRADAGQWVTKYKVQYKEKEEDPWTDVRNIQGSYIFEGNRNYGPEKVSNELEVPIFASYIKIIPVAWHSHISMRVGVDHYLHGREGVITYDGAVVSEADSEYTKTMSATASTLQSWADNVVKKTVASNNASDKCSNPPGPDSDRVCANGGSEQSQFNSCTAKHEMWTDLKTNPVLRHFVDAWEDGDDATAPLNVFKYMNSPNIANNPMGIGWLQIPTTGSNSLRAGWGSAPGTAGHSNFYPKESLADYTIDGSSKLTMLIVRKFTSDESKAIYDALQNQTGGPNRPRGSKIVSGHNFIFTKEGHISFIPPGKEIKKENQVTYLNPFINPEHDNIAPESGGKKNTLSGVGDPENLHIDALQSNTMRGDGPNGVGKFSGYPGSKKGIELVYAMGPKTVMNRALTYILYTPADEHYLIDNEPGDSDNLKALEIIGKSRYYLLYNPIHTLEFRRFFQSHLQVKASGSTPPDADLYYSVPSNIATPYAAGSVAVQDPTGCRDPIVVPSYATTIAKYCNAFQITGLMNASGFHDIKHYADPTCPFAMSTGSAKHGFATNSNVTQQSIREDFYKLKRTSTPFSSWQVGNERISSIEVQEPYISLTWACESHTPDKNSSIQGWMNQSGMLAYNSKSFMKDLVNSVINTSVYKQPGTEKSIQRIPSTMRDPDTGDIRPMSARELDDFLKNDAKKWGEPKCLDTAKEITLCSTHVNVAGNIVNSNTNQSNFCGGDPNPEEPKTEEEKAVEEGGGTPSPDNPDKSRPECEDLAKVPECAQFGEVGEDAVYKEIDGKTIYTACCLHSNDIDMIDCPKKENGSCEPVKATLTEPPPEEDENIEGGGDGGDSVSVADLSGRIDKAMNVAVTSKNAYPDDSNIVDKADLILTESKRLQTDASKLQEDLEALDVTGRRATFNTELGNLVDDVVELEKVEKELVKLISDNYLFGQKKMYVFGAIGAIVLILLLFFFMRGGGRKVAPAAA
tara:strand:+ start:6937 stop:11094 length:4158 start_codon:yes stop_codon:yes gene_type:complete